MMDNPCYTFDYHRHYKRYGYVVIASRPHAFAWHGPLTPDGRPAPCESFGQGMLENVMKDAVTWHMGESWSEITKRFQKTRASRA